MKKYFSIILLLFAFDSNAQYFEPFGNGHGINTGGTVYALSGDSANNLLYVLGIFQTADDTGYNGNCAWTGNQYDSLFNFFNVPTTIPHTAKWGDTTVITWDHSIRLMNGKQLLQALPQTNGEINAVCICNNELYIAGDFNTAGGTFIGGGIAKWNDTGWETVGGGLSCSSCYVYSLASYGNELIAGGFYNSIGGINVNNIARWNGTQWNAMGEGIRSGGPVFGQSMIEYNNQLWVIGEFDSAGTINCSGLAIWNDSIWSTPSNYPLQDFGYSAITIYHNKLYIAGHFYNQAFTSEGSLIVYDGTSFVNFLPLNNQLGYHGWIQSLSSFDDYLYVGGTFDTMGVACNGIVRFSDDSINAVGKEISWINFLSITISPNPATTEIKITNLSPTENQISIFNLLGQQVKSIRVSNVQSTILPVSDLPAGIYLVTIFDGEKFVCRKLDNE